MQNVLSAAVEQSPMSDEDLEEEFSDPDPTDYHGQKRNLLKKGLEQGELTWQEVRDGLPPEHTSDRELETFLFTCENMGIDIEGRPDAS
jgi:hypothetical protein